MSAIKRDPSQASQQAMASCRAELVKVGSIAVDSERRLRTKVTISSSEESCRYAKRNFSRVSISKNFKRAVWEVGVEIGTGNGTEVMEEKSSRRSDIAFFEDTTSDTASSRC